jgi:hypothetical protein
VVLKRLVLLGFLIAVCLSTVLLAQPEIPLRYRYQKWEDRWEGIQAGYQAGGERLELISATIRADLPVAKKPQKLFVRFSLDKPLNIAITVRAPEENYWMEPIDETGRKNFKGRPGLNRFSWDGRVVRYLKKTAKDLYALAAIARAGPVRTLVPVLLYDSSPLPETLKVQGYEFTFLPNADVDINYEIKAPDGKPLISDDLKGMPRDHMFTIPWESKDFEDGEYQLVINASFPVRDKPPMKPQPDKLMFQHRRTITVRE